ncbi:MAG: TetR/AcrR family transcriptional regulator [Deltaproteobacteria bacterium]|nr:TetR/AcrR family transcriptional regulator [Deltaproteobacteria bacterium]
MTESRFSTTREPGKPRTSRATRGGRASRAREGDKRERILRAATRVFARKGFYATKVSEVAKAAGVADGTIYLYFKNKDDLLVSLFEDRIMLLLAALERALAERPTPEERLRCVIEMQLGLLEGERDLAEVITVNLRQSTRLMKQYAAPKFMLYLDAIARVVAEGQKAGAFRTDVSPHLMARTIFGALDGIIMTWALGKAEPGGLSRASTQVADVLLAGLLAKKER